MAGSRIQFLECRWTKGHCSSMTIDWRPPSAICHLSLFTGQLASLRVSKQQSKKGRVGRKPVFLYLITEVIPHLPCHILLVRSKSLDPAHTKGRGLPKGLNARSWRSLGANLKAAYPSATGLGATEAFGSECICFLRQVNIISFST